MPEDIKISVVVPVYHTRDYLEGCLGSLLDQSYRNFELLLVDDGSRDGSGEICDRFQEMDPRVKVLHLENGGVSRARNKGLEAAEGELIAFLDSDDKLEPDYLKKLLSWQQEAGVSLSICGYREMDSAASSLNAPPSPLLEADEFLSFALNEANGFLFSVWGTLFPAAWGLRFDESIAYGEDSLFVVQLIQKAGRLVYRPEPLYLYNTGRSGNTYQRRSLKKFQDSLKVWHQIEARTAGSPEKVRSQLNRIICDNHLKAARQAQAEKAYPEKKKLLQEARKRYRLLKKDAAVSAKDKLRLGLLCLMPAAGAKLWEKLRGGKA